MTWSLLCSPPFPLGATDPFYIAADLNFNYSAAQGTRQLGRAFWRYRPGGLDQHCNFCIKTREIVELPRARGPVATCCRCAGSTHRAYPQEAWDAASAVGEELPSGLSYMADNSWSGRFLNPLWNSSIAQFQARLRSPCRAYSFPFCRTSETGA